MPGREAQAVHRQEIRPDQQAPAQEAEAPTEVLLPDPEEDRRVQGRISPGIRHQEATEGEGEADAGEGSRRITALSLWQESL